MNEHQELTLSRDYLAYSHIRRMLYRMLFALVIVSGTLLTVNLIFILVRPLYFSLIMLGFWIGSMVVLIPITRNVNQAINLADEQLQRLRTKRKPARDHQQLFHVWDRELGLFTGVIDCHTEDSKQRIN